jgi:hypothetical protein
MRRREFIALLGSGVAVWPLAARVARTALAMAAMMLAACASAMSQGATPPQAPARPPGKSSPPDTTRYIRPAIPEDRLNKPPPPPIDANAPSRNRKQEN